MKRQAWQGSMGVAALLAVTGWAGPTAACGMCDCQTEPRAVINLIRDVPLNLEIPLPGFDEAVAEPRIERVSDGVQAPATVTREQGGAPMWWLKVDQDLEPNTAYRIAGGQGLGEQFTTGLARDEQAPTLAEVRTMPGGAASLCDLESGGLITLIGASDGEAFAVWIELELDVAGTAQRIYLDYQFGDIRLGHSAMGCFGPTELANVSPDQGYPGRVRLHDAAGNVGDWKTFVLTLGAEQPGGCGTPTGSAAAAGSDQSQPPNPSGGSAGSAAPDGTAADAQSPRTSQGCAMAPTSSRRSQAPASGGLLPLVWLLVRRRRARAC